MKAENNSDLALPSPERLALVMTLILLLMLVGGFMAQLLV